MKARWNPLEFDGMGYKLGLSYGAKGCLINSSTRSFAFFCNALHPSAIQPHHRVSTSSCEQCFSFKPLMRLQVHFKFAFVWRVFFVGFLLSFFFAVFYSCSLFFFRCDVGKQRIKLKKIEKLWSAAAGQNINFHLSLFGAPFLSLARCLLTLVFIRFGCTAILKELRATILNTYLHIWLNLR